MGEYCNYCGISGMPLLETRSGLMICELCAEKNHMCEMCGSLRRVGETAEGQRHYEEECFK